MAEPNRAESAPAADVEAVAPESRPGRKGLLLLVGLILLACAGGGAVAYSQYTWITQASDRFRSPSGDTGQPIEYGVFKELRNMIINPAETNGRRYLMINVGFESTDAGALKELEQKEVVVRDVLIKRLSARTVEELASVDQRAALKEELRQAVNEILKGKIDRLYFTQYVLQ